MAKFLVVLISAVMSVAIAIFSVQNATPVPVTFLNAKTVALPVAESSVPYANLYIWREKRKDAPIHAIAASVFQNGSKVLEVAPIHCAGYRKRQLEKYVQKDVMSYLNARFGITFLADGIRLEPIECPIDGCPWHDRLMAGQDKPSNHVEASHG